MNYKDLNPRQSEALFYNDGPLLILAGAGSGKTKVVTSKIAYLIEEKNVLPSEILAITFTNKAASEMKSRVAKLIGNTSLDMWIGTFHSICLKILYNFSKYSIYKSSFSIYDRNDQVTLVKDCVKELNLSKDLYKHNSIIAKISELKNDFIDPDTFINSNYGDFYLRNVGEIYSLYEKKLLENKALDFDDLILKAIDLIEKNEEVKDYLKKRFSYIFVDEYQDTNKAQYRLIKLLCRENPKLTVVGDNDQSIYKWRGADISNILNFEKDFKNAKVILLEQNYRSTPEILKVANQVIKNNPNRKDKNLWTENSGKDQVKYKQFDHSQEESYGVVNKIEHLNYKGYEFKDMAILYRTNAQSRSFEEALIRENIPYKIVGGLKFYDRKEIKDILAYLMLIQNQDDDIAFKRVINEPKRGIGLTSVDKIAQAANSESMSMFSLISDKEKLDELNIRSRNNIAKFAEMIKSFEEKKDQAILSNLIEDLIIESGYLEELQKENTIESRTRIDNIKELVSTAADFEKANPDGKLEDFLSGISLISDADENDEENSVKLMTIHAAKGLEYKIVFLVGLEENLFPSSRSIDNDEDLEEERRLCYVALTRAEELLYLSSARNRTIYGQTKPALESRFIEEMGSSIERVEDERKDLKLNKNLVEVKDYTSQKEKAIKRFKSKKEQVKNNNLDVNVGDKVVHKLWKQGMVVSKTKKGSDYEIVVAFDSKGLKKLMLSMAPIKLVK